MTTVIGVLFTRAGKVYWFDPGELELQDGQGVIVETSRGIEYGQISGSRMDMPDEMVVQPLRQVLRAATQEDVQHVEDNKQKEKDAFVIAQQRIDKHALEMKLVEVEYAFDGSRILFYFTANGRVDFRELVRDLASHFRTRIELRQIGVRDEAKMLGGLGPCGRPICCRQFLPNFQPVSIRMAKEQNLSLNPTKISGQCGRLMCCLKYEQDAYEEARKKVPKVGREVVTPDGTGVVTDINVLKETIKAKVYLPDGSYEFKEYFFDETAKKGEPAPQRRAKVEEAPLSDFFIEEPSAPPAATDVEQRPPRERRDRRKPRRNGADAPAQREDRSSPPAPSEADVPMQDRQGEQRRRRRRRGGSGHSGQARDPQGEDKGNT